MKPLPKKTVFAGLEAPGAYGVDVDPSATPAKAIETERFSITPIEGEELKREIDNGMLGAKPSLLSGVYVMIEFDVAMAGSGTAGTAVPYAPLIMGCGFAENDLSGDVDPRMEYDPVDESFSALSFHTWYGGNWHKLLGARGSLSVKSPIPGQAYWHFKFMGLFVPISESAVPARDYTAFKQPVPTGATNTEVTVHGKIVACNDFNLDLNGALSYDETSAAQEIYLSDREVKGSMVIETPVVGSGGLDVFARALDRATGALLFEQGVTSGNIINISGPALEVGKVSYDGEKKKSRINMPYTLLPTSAGNDDVKIITK